MSISWWQHGVNKHTTIQAERENEKMRNQLHSLMNYNQTMLSINRVEWVTEAWIVLAHNILNGQSFDSKDTLSQQYHKSTSKQKLSLQLATWHAIRSLDCWKVCICLYYFHTLKTVLGNENLKVIFLSLKQNLFIIRS